MHERLISAWKEARPRFGPVGLRCVFRELNPEQCLFGAGDVLLRAHKNVEWNGMVRDVSAINIWFGSYRPLQCGGAIRSFKVKLSSNLRVSIALTSHADPCETSSAPLRGDIASSHSSRSSSRTWQTSASEERQGDRRGWLDTLRNRTASPNSKCSGLHLVCLLISLLCDIL